MKNFILIVSLAIVIGLWFSRSYVVVKEYLFIYIFISSFTYIIISYIKSIQKYKDEGVNVSHDDKFSYILIYGVIIAILISKIATMLPQEYNGREFNNFGNYFKNEFASKTSETSESNKDRFSLSTSGYSGNDKSLGGPISLNYNEVFKVNS
ncbi:MAG: hypothetical protein MUO60_09500, partial [Clostridiaceae bacterium]|nr:hypothetical protein [Clostridiaceae bacterium]